MKKKAIIIPGNTDLNRGDQALVWETIRLVEDVYGANNVVCKLMTGIGGPNFQLQNGQTEKLGYEFIDTILKHPSRRFINKAEDSKSYTGRTLIQWGVQALLDYIRTRPLLSSCSVIRRFGECFLNKAQKCAIQDIKSADAVFVKGGGFIHSYGAKTDPYFLYFLTYHIRLAEAYGKKTIILPNSIGPLKNRIAKRIALKALNHTALLTTRENISNQYLASLNVKSKYYPDLGFFLNPSERDMSDYLLALGIPVEKKKVVITLRPYRFLGKSNPQELFQNYINSIVCLVSHIVNKGYHVTFMAHTLGPSSHEDDRLAIREVTEILPKDLRVHTSYIEDYKLTCKDVEKIYSYYDYMVGTRFHSVIFALNVEVPSIAIAYGGNKGKGIMNVLGNDDYSIDMDKIDESTLISVFDNLERNREAYLANLQKEKEEIQKQRTDLINCIREVLA